MTKRISRVRVLDGLGSEACRSGIIFQSVVQICTGISIFQIASNPVKGFQKRHCLVADPASFLQVWMPLQDALCTGAPIAPIAKLQATTSQGYFLQNADEASKILVRVGEHLETHIAAPVIPHTYMRLHRRV